MGTFPPSSYTRMPHLPVFVVEAQTKKGDIVQLRVEAHDGKEAASKVRKKYRSYTRIVSVEAERV